MRTIIRCDFSKAPRREADESETTLGENCASRRDAGAIRACYSVAISTL